MGYFLFPFLLLSLGHIGTLSLSQEIRILDLVLNQESCCKDGLNVHDEAILIQSLIHLNVSIYEKYVATYEIKKANHDDYNEIVHLDLMDECTGFQVNATYNCVEMGEGMYHINITLQLFQNYSGAEIRGKLAVSSEINITSNVQRLPSLPDKNEALGILTINRKRVNDSCCNEIIDGTSLLVEFDCASAPTPCVIEMLINDSKVVNQSENTAKVVYTYENGNELLVLVRYAACILDGKVAFINCTIKSAYYQELNDKQGISTNNLLIYVLTPLLLIGAFIILAVILLYWYLRKKKCKQELNPTMNLHSNIFCTGITLSSLSTETLNDNNLDDRMKDLISEIEARRNTGEYNSMYDDQIKGPLGFQVLLNAIKNKNILVATYLITDASSFKNDPAKYEIVRSLVEASKEPEIRGSFYLLNS